MIYICFIMKITRTISELEKEEWTFYISEFKVYLNTYHLLERKTKRHNFKAIKTYERLINRNSNIEESEVPFGNDVKRQALDEFISRIEVLRWSERNN